MDAEHPSYYVCTSCLADAHEKCGGIAERGMCACACQRAVVEGLRAEKLAAADQAR
jgi:hypothetical protein